MDLTQTIYDGNLEMRFTVKTGTTVVYQVTLPCPSDLTPATDEKEFSSDMESKTYRKTVAGYYEKLKILWRNGLLTKEQITAINTVYDYSRRSAYIIYLKPSSDRDHEEEVVLTKKTFEPIKNQAGKFHVSLEMLFAEFRTDIEYGMI